MLSNPWPGEIERQLTEKINVRGLSRAYPALTVGSRSDRAFLSQVYLVVRPTQASAAL
jgi:hypothetical protein